MRTGRRMAIAATAVAVSTALAVAGCTPGVGLPAADSAIAEASPSPNGTDPSSPDPSGAAASPTLTPPAPTAAAPGAAAAAPPAGRAPTQVYAVGSRQLTLSRGANRPLRTVVWYPATGGGGSGAAPAAGVFPLVLFSHGLTATPESYQRITSRIAAAGFIVAGPAYPYTNGAAATYNPADLVNQPADGSEVITGLLTLNNSPGDPLTGHINGSRIAAAGHSGGGYTTVGMLAGARDNRLRAAIVIAGGSLGGSFTGPPASVLFIHGESDPVVGYGIGRSVFGMVPWPKAFLAVTGGDHSSYLFGSSAAATAVVTSIVDFLRWSLYDDAAAKGQLTVDATGSGAATFESTL